MTPQLLTRRAALALGLTAAALPALAQDAFPIGDPARYASGRLHARPGPVRFDEAHRLKTFLGLDAKDAILFVPPDLDLSAPVPFVLALHGAGQTANGILGDIDREARRLGFVVLAVPSRGPTWDLANGPVGPDAAFIDLALKTAFERVPVDPGRIAVFGLSDGGSYALSTGMVNGDLFSDVLAYAPMLFAAPSARGTPRFFFSSGRNDRYAFHSRAREMVGQLEGFGYDVEFHVHRGGHIIDRSGLRQGLQRFLSGGAD